MVLKLKKLSPLMILTILGIVIGGLVGAQSGWFSFIYDPGELEVDDTYMIDDFELRELPYWFSAGVSITGSGFTGQEHTVDLNIFQARPPNGAPWYADGGYSLDLKLAGSVMENIMSGSFTDLGTVDPHSDSYLWTPSVSPENYTITLNITDISWSNSPSASTADFSNDNKLLEPESLWPSGYNFTLTQVLFDGSLDYIYLPGETVSFNMTLEKTTYEWSDNHCYLEVYIELLDGSGRVLVVPDTGDINPIQRNGFAKH